MEFSTIKAGYSQSTTAMSIDHEVELLIGNKHTCIL